MHGLLSAMRMQAELAMGSLAHAKAGVVTSYDPDHYCARVKLQPEDVETGWLPIASSMVGSSWGLFTPVEPDTQVLVIFLEAHPEAGVIIGALWSDQQPPVSVPAAEAWLVHKKGASLKFTNDGNVTLTAPLTTIDGELKVTGNVTDQSKTNSVTVKALRDDYNAHKHTGVQTGGGSTETTDHPAT